jgi:hypothetical protein
MNEEDAAMEEVSMDRNPAVSVLASDHFAKIAKKIISAPDGEAMVEVTQATVLIAAKPIPAIMKAATAVRNSDDDIARAAGVMEPAPMKAVTSVVTAKIGACETEVDIPVKPGMAARRDAVSMGRLILNPRAGITPSPATGAKSAVGGIEPQTKFLRGLEMKRLSAGGRWMKDVQEISEEKALKTICVRTNESERTSMIA